MTFYICSIWLEMAKPQKDGPVDWDAYKKVFYFSLLFNYDIRIFS